MIVARSVSLFLPMERQGDAILENINMNVDKGTYWSVFGPEGSGKSSLMLVLALLERPSLGELLFSGHSVSSMSSATLEKFRRGRVGFIGRQYALMNGISVAENIELPLVYLNYSRKERKLRVAEVAELLKISHLLSEKAELLNMLQVQLTALARAIVAGPDLLVADEPTALMNSRYSSEFMDALEVIHDDGTTLVHGTSSLFLAERAIRRTEIYDGHLIG